MKQRKLFWRKLDSAMQVRLLECMNAGMSQGEIAAELGVNRHSVRKWLRHLAYKRAYTYRKAEL